MFALFTDFTLIDPYVGQMHAVLAHKCPHRPIIDLFHQVPSFDVRSAAYLLPAYSQFMPEGTILICVVDPGVGGDRPGVAVKTDRHWYVGPDNGLFTMMARRQHHAPSVYTIDDIPSDAAPSFHGRDVFALIAANIANGDESDLIPGNLIDVPKDAWPDDLPQVIYIDHFGNAITGIRSSIVGKPYQMEVKGATLSHARVFADVRRSEVFWYGNANGLIEIAAGKKSAAEVLGLKVGDRVQFKDH